MRILFKLELSSESFSGSLHSHSGEASTPEPASHFAAIDTAMHIS